MNFTQGKCVFFHVKFTLGNSKFICAINDNLLIQLTQLKTKKDKYISYYTDKKSIHISIKHQNLFVTNLVWQAYEKHDLLKIN